MAPTRVALARRSVRASSAARGVPETMIEFPVAAAGVEPGPHFDAVPIAVFGDPAADGCGTVNRAAGQFPQW